MYSGRYVFFPFYTLQLWMKMFFFARQKYFSFKRSLLIVGVHACAKVLFKKIFPIPMCSSLFPTFSSVRLMASGIMLSSLTYLQLNLVQGDRYESIFMKTCMHIWTHNGVTRTPCWRRFNCKVKESHLRSSHSPWDIHEFHRK